MTSDDGGLKSFLAPWHDSLEDPKTAQESTLSGLLEGYRKTRYGRERGAEGVSTIDGFQNSFPIVTYPELRPYIDM